MMAPVSFLLNALVGIFLLYFTIGDLFDDHPDDDRYILWIMFWEGACFLAFGVAGLLFA